ncbi:ScbA/BarX family gamma-butyrolactone biosynthesis protein [Streptacidiphilus melanogenes]|uniref:ScbA/BarX family gamma-butyrolactone biosynthesis protein n=1 Tax=Streptacidiphilus melanogenes TaxID=411235 RepID=UPI0005A8862E|nr:ScbA/BarX family gamma-butyrolactone biosynthesis protein [Streptacidiphilus melanogenes]
MSISAPPRQIPLRHAAPAKPARRLSFARHLPPEAVHKAAAREVLLTDALQLAEDRFAVAAVWHRDRFLHHDVRHDLHHDIRGAFHHQLHHGGFSGPTDPLLAVETARQTLIHLSHRFYGVPEGHPFVLNTLDFDLQDTVTSVLARGPRPVVLDVTCTRAARTPRRLGMALDAAVTVGGAHIGRVRMQWEMLDPRLYALARTRARNEARTTAPFPRGLRRLAPREVGYAYDEHVLLARAPEDAPGEFWLDQNTDHPVLFDHPSDHVPGMVLLEAFRQAVTTMGAPDIPLRPALTHVSAAFTTFGEPDAPVRITVRPRSGGPEGPGTAEVSAVQGDTPLVSAHVGYQLPRVLTRREVAS